MQQRSWALPALGALLLNGCMYQTVDTLENSFDYKVDALERRGEKLDRELKQYIADMNELRQSAANMHSNVEDTAAKFQGLLDEAQGDLNTTTRSKGKSK